MVVKNVQLGLSGENKICTSSRRFINWFTSILVGLMSLADNENAAPLQVSIIMYLCPVIMCFEVHELLTLVLYNN